MNLSRFAFAFTICVIVFHQTSAQCPTTKGWKKTGLKCIYIHDKEMPFADAQKVCNNLGHSLVMPKTKEEMNDIGAHVRQMKSVVYHGIGAPIWFGMKRDTDSLKVYYTDGTQVKLPYTFWQNNEPTATWRPGMDCVLYYADLMKLTSAPCNENCYPICDQALKPMPDTYAKGTTTTTTTTEKPITTPKPIIPDIIPKPAAASVDALDKLYENVKALRVTNQKINEAVTENKQNIDKAKEEINTKMTEEEKKAKDREQQLNSKYDAGKKDMEDKIKSATDDIKNKVNGLDEKTNSKNAQKDVAAVTKATDVVLHIVIT
ncbi:hypothetical protein B4U80_11919, partial [Leptotrombidium deliense]